MNIGNCTTIDVSDVVCIDRHGLQASVPDEIVICGDFVILIENARVADIGEVHQLISAMEALRSGQCSELELLVRDKSLLAGIVHGRAVKWSARYTQNYRDKYSILVAGCQDDLSKKLKLILRVINRSSP